MSAAIFLPLASGFVYAVAAHMLKRGMGIGPRRVVFVQNFLMAAMFSPLLIFAPPPPGETAWFEPLAAGTTFFLGQIFTFAAIHRGHVSVSTPVMGSKVLFVALLAPWIAGDRIPASTWTAAALTATAVALLGLGGHRDAAGSPLPTILLAATASAFFATTDLLTEKWSRDWDALRFVPLLFFCNAALSMALIPTFSEPLRSIRPRQWKRLLPAQFLLALQALGVALSLGLFGNAARVNILYSSRGLWSVLIVLLAARWLHSGEQSVPAPLLLARLAGAVLLIAAIAMATIPNG